MSKEGQLYSMLLLPAVEEQSESPSFFSIMLYFDQVPLNWPVWPCGGHLVPQFSWHYPPY